MFHPTIEFRSIPLKRLSFGVVGDPENKRFIRADPPATLIF